MDPPLIVAAIDIGRSFSGWAFSIRGDFSKNPTKVFTKQHQGSERRIVSKYPTCILIRPDGQSLEEFGQGAETRFQELSKNGEDKNWYFFKEFKKVVADQVKTLKDIKVKDVNGKKLPADLIYSLAISYLKNDLLQTGRLPEDEIKWVLTVPAAWGSIGQQFVTEAAKQAGINVKELEVVPEPTAAFLFCKYLPQSEMVAGSDVNFSKLHPKTNYIVLDAGGNTVNTTVLQAEGGVLKLSVHDGVSLVGGNDVQEGFKAFLSDVFGREVFKEFTETQRHCYYDLLNDFEIKKKKSVVLDGSGRVTFTIPVTMTELFHEGNSSHTLEQAIKRSKYANHVSCIADKIRLDGHLMQTFFQKTIDKILQHLTDIVQQVEGPVIILMVGGFSESPLLYQSVLDKFPKLDVMVPKNAGTAILCGSVVYGHNPLKTVASEVKSKICALM